LVEKNSSSSLYLSITEQKAYVLDISNILDIGNKNIVLYRIEFMPAIHRPTYGTVKPNFEPNLSAKRSSLKPCYSKTSPMTPDFIYDFLTLLQR
jgi:hypothetical protein